MVTLPEDDRPTKWYNIVADLPEPLPPPMDPKEGPSRVKMLPELLLGECLRQEASTQRWIDIPQEIQDLYAQAGRPRPLFRAKRLEAKLRTPARLYYKAEFYSPTGSHKVNTALAQAWYAEEEGYERLTTETGAGQWGTALAYAASLAGLKTTIYWVRAVHDWKAQRRAFMKLYGAEVYASPSDHTATGRDLLKQDPNHPGSLGIAVSEGLEDARGDDKAIYCLGSVLNHVLLHQTVIGLETKRQFERFGEYPDLMVSCLGGGSNFACSCLPFMGDKLSKRLPADFVACESSAAPHATECSSEREPAGCDSSIHGPERYRRAQTPTCGTRQVPSVLQYSQPEPLIAVPFAANLPRMRPVVEAALVGVGGSVIVAVTGFLTPRSSTRRTIKAGTDTAHENRVWDKQASAYVDAIAAIQHRQKGRESQFAPPRQPPSASRTACHWGRTGGAPARLRLSGRAQGAPGSLGRRAQTQRSLQHVERDSRTEAGSQRTAGAGDTPARLGPWCAP